MTSEQARQLNENPVWQAFCRGEVVQVHWNEGWEDEKDVNAHAMVSKPHLYRIKPKPVECWGNLYGADERISYHPTREEADTRAKEMRQALVRFMETERFPCNDKGEVLP